MPKIKLSNQYIKTCLDVLDSHVVKLRDRVIGANQIDSAASVKIERDRKLKESDYIIMSDSKASASCITAYKKYRQELRDLPNAEDFDPNNFEWPVEPDYEKEI